jgi:radical SAM protein with 4Fe4S-binding SPASM domain
MERPACAGLWLTPMVHVNGDVTTCCLDEHLVNRIGNVRDTPLAALWSDATIEGWREAQLAGRFADSGPYCTRCNWASAGAVPPDVVARWRARKGAQT